MLVINFAGLLVMLALIILRMYFYHVDRHAGVYHVNAVGTVDASGKTTYTYSGTSTSGGSSDNASTQVLIAIIFMTPFQVLFLVLLVLSELKNQWVRTYFNFLDSKRARGLFMIMLAFTFLDTSARDHFVEIILAIILVSIGFINTIIGWGVSSDNTKNTH